MPIALSRADSFPPQHSAMERGSLLPRVGGLFFRVDTVKAAVRRRTPRILQLFAAARSWANNCSLRDRPQR
jgi:hypothetical protein